MAHELHLEDNGHASMFYVSEPPWHGLGKRLNAPPSAAEGIHAAGLDWEVVKAPLFYHASIKHTDIVPNRFALVPGEGWPDRKRPMFGMVTEKYHILQNCDAFAFFDPMVKKGYAQYETAGALGKGERVWVLAKLPEAIQVDPEDRVERYILLSNTHDGHSAVSVKFTPIRVVCQNTLSMALNDARQAFSIQHDETLFPRLGEAADEMRDRIETRYEQIAADFLTLRNVTIASDQAEAYFNTVYAEPDDLPPPTDEYQERLQKERRRILQRDREACLRIYQDGPRARMKGSRTLWGAYNAVTEYVDHGRMSSSSPRRMRSRLNTIWFGEGQRRKLRAFDEAKKLVGQPG